MENLIRQVEHPFLLQYLPFFKEHVGEELIRYYPKNLYLFLMSITKYIPKASKGVIVLSS